MNYRMTDRLPLLMTTVVGSENKSNRRKNDTKIKNMKRKIMKSRSVNAASLTPSTNRAPLVLAQESIHEEETLSSPTKSTFREQRLLTVEQAAFYLSYDRQTVYEKVWLGEISHIPFGKRGIRIDKYELDKYIRQNSTCKKRKCKRTEKSTKEGGDYNEKAQ